MSEDNTKPTGPDLTTGVAIADGAMLRGHVGGESVLLARRGAEVFAIGADCTHYHGPLEEGLMVGETVRCPWHHACFSLRTGEALRAPALDGVACWRVEQRDGRAFVREKIAIPARAAPSPAPSSIVIVGGGAAGNAAAEMLRRDGYGGSLVMLSADTDVPCDRPNLSKDYLAGTAPEEFVPLRSAAFYQEHHIELRLNTQVAAIDTAARRVRLEGGGECGYDALLLATGAEPVRLDIPGAELPHVHYLRTVADCRALIAKAL
ncbi:MAG: FAD-dependent oxidoreductase, partial [Acetobacteraceae bacterium]